MARMAQAEAHGTAQEDAPMNSFDHFILAVAILVVIFVVYNNPLK